MISYPDVVFFLRTLPCLQHMLFVCMYIDMRENWNVGRRLVPRAFTEWIELIRRYVIVRFASGCCLSLKSHYLCYRKPTSELSPGPPSGCVCVRYLGGPNCSTRLRRDSSILSRDRYTNTISLPYQLTPTLERPTLTARTGIGWR